MSDLLIDTSVLIDFLRQSNKTNTLLVRLSHQNLAIAMITHTELYAGQSVWKKDHAKQELELLLSGLHCFNLDTSTSTKAGELRAKYDVDLFDAIIAATALLHDLELVTLNTKHFTKIPGLRLHSNAN